jgi:hypothetical protein
MALGQWMIRDGQPTVTENFLKYSNRAIHLVGAKHTEAESHAHR